MKPEQMRPERWRMVERIYHDALERDAEERAAFLVEACAGDEALRNEIESLIRCDARAEHFIEAPALEVAAQLRVGEQSQAMIGRQISHYQILSLIGAGGMGKVYLAQDSSLRRKVALKLLPAHFTADESRVRRFVQEAHAASALNHPNIITIYEIGQAEGVHLIATEFIDGQTLRQRMTGARLKLRDALEVATQVASALAAAHAAGILHRDIKPENVMVRPDGLVKVLDFGLAKLTQEPELDSEAATLVKVNTDPGTVIGTISYMSPEQARGLEVDGRSDIFSLGVTLYEMLTGKAPFEGATTADVIAAILDREPTALSLHSPESPAELQRIVTKALRKDRDERYQGIKDLLVDLKSLKQDLEMAEAGLARTTSSAEYIVAQIRRYKVGVGLSLAALVVAAIAVFLYFNRAPVLTDKDTILVADFVNTTGDAVFDDTLKQALAVQLEQSPFLNIFPEERVHEALRFMSRSPEERVTRDLAREICQRQGLKAMLLGSIAKFDRNYAITLEAVNAQTGEAIARQQVEAEGKDQVLKALGAAATKLREKLGESLASIQKYDAPIEQATTSSLDAFKAFAQGNELWAQGKVFEVIPFYQRAVELDPNFALAWAMMARVYGGPLLERELATKAAEKAFELRDRVSEREKLAISERLYANVAVNPEKRNEILELWTRAYPREGNPHALLGLRYFEIGQFEKAIEELREAIRLNPNYDPSYNFLSLAFIRLNRFDEAREISERALQQKLDSPFIHSNLYLVAFIHGDTAAMKRQIDWAAGTPNEALSLDWQAETSAFTGKLRQARGFSRDAIVLAQSRNLKAIAAASTTMQALRDSFFGNCRQARADISGALASGRDSISLLRGAGAMVVCGDIGKAQSLTDELARLNSKDTQINVIWLPLLRVRIEIQRGAPDKAIQLLQSVIPYERAALFYPAYTRGLAYLRLRAGTEAAAEFQKILDNRGQDPASFLYPLAHLGLARAAELTGDTAKSRKAYQDFFALWNDADADLPILIEAKKEYGKLK